MIAIRVFYSTEAWIGAIRDDFIKTIAEIPAFRQPRLCLAGGKTPEPVYQVFSQLMAHGKAGLAPAILVPGDERVPGGERALGGEQVPGKDQGPAAQPATQLSDLNETMLGRSFAPALASGGAILYSWFGNGNEKTVVGSATASSPGLVDDLAQTMIRTMEARLALLASPGQFLLASPGTPLFDLCYLGMGADGHTAGLFPGTSSLDAPGLCTHGLAPQPPRQRVSLGFSALISTGRTRFILSVAGKEAALERLRHGDPDCPAVRAATKDTIAFVLA